MGWSRSKTKFQCLPLPPGRNHWSRTTRKIKNQTRTWRYFTGISVVDGHSSVSCTALEKINAQVPSVLLEKLYSDLHSDWFTSSFGGLWVHVCCWFRAGGSFFRSYLTESNQWIRLWRSKRFSVRLLQNSPWSWFTNLPKSLWGLCLSCSYGADTWASNKSRHFCDRMLLIRKQFGLLEKPGPLWCHLGRAVGCAL